MSSASLNKTFSFIPYISSIRNSLKINPLTMADSLYKDGTIYTEQYWTCIVYSKTNKLENVCSDTH